MADERATARAPSIVVGAALIAIGVLFMLITYFGLGFDLLAWAWPFLIVAVGLGFFVAMLGSGSAGAPFAIPRTIVTTVGLILLFDVLTGLWATWVYAWALVGPTAVGLGVWIAGAWSGYAGMRSGERTLAAIGPALFLGSFVFFEWFVGLSGLDATAVGALAGVALIAAGAWLVLTAGRRGPEASPRSRRRATS